MYKCLILLLSTIAIAASCFVICYLNIPDTRFMVLGIIGLLGFISTDKQVRYKQYAKKRRY